MPKVKFVGIDTWNRPIFKDTASMAYYGDLDTLFDWSTTEEEVLSQVTSDSLVYFGNQFDCEPLGETVHNITIVSSARRQMKFQTGDVLGRKNATLTNVKHAAESVLVKVVHSMGDATYRFQTDTVIKETGERFISVLSASYVEAHYEKIGTFK